MRPKTLIIAEAGVNHNGDIVMAKRLIEAAASAGADIVKFQTFKADKLATRTAEKAKYQVAATGIEETQSAMLKRLELSAEAHSELITHCEAHSISFLSTAFDDESLDLLISFGASLFKIPSGEISNLPYLRRIGGIGGEVMLSTGMATLGDIESAIDALEAAGTPRKNITVLHCTTEYPTPMGEVNLMAMSSIAGAFGVNVGYSDHTRGIEVAIAAVALGARVIEKHFTLDNTLPGPDHRASLEPEELNTMVRCIRNIEVALGDGIKRPTEAEMLNRTVVRKSIVAAKSIEAGEILSSHNLTVKRPGTGISPMHWDDIVGRIARRRYEADEVIEL